MAPHWWRDEFGDRVKTGKPTNARGAGICRGDLFY